MVAKLRTLNNFAAACAPSSMRSRVLCAVVRHLSGSGKKSAPPQQPYWDYSPAYGPTEWSKTWKTGQRQSPIDLCSKTAKFDSSLGSFIIDHKPVGFTASNIGNNVSMTPDSQSNGSDELLLSGGPLESVYRFAEMHMHWGEVSVCGCEHMLDGRRFAGELHLVHWNTGYGEQPVAMEKSDGLAVLGVFLDAQDGHKCHPGLDLILDMFGRISDVGEDGSTHSTQDFTPYQLLPAQSNAYFMYLGSLTTPPLLESVVWTVFMQPINISNRQWQRLNQVVTSKSPHGGGDRFCKQCASSITPDTPSVISNNFREVQPLCERVVRSSVDLNRQWHSLIVSHQFSFLIISLSQTKKKHGGVRVW